MDKALHDNIKVAYDAAFFSKEINKERKLYNDKIGFYNLGYWKGIEQDSSIELAQINLIETLVRFFIPNKTSNILDVACGRGVSTKFLTKYFDPKNITGINISETQLELCQLVAPECTFRLMDAASLDFGDSSIDNILCIEATHHFRTQKKFLQEAYRVLKPGGRLAMQDLMHDEYQLDVLSTVLPKENYLANADEFRARLVEVGFRYTRVEDDSTHCTRAVGRAIVKRMEADDVEPEKIAEVDRFYRHYIGSFMAYAIK